ncbi:MAG: hypothetical protein IJ374_00780 [Lachnospiraceae bacterium]|nr:hypothetical protein [Lachnospiraceae bacterium]
MVQEFLQMSHVSTDERLKDVSLTVFEGEIIFLLSNHRGELEEIWQIIAGHRKISSGRLFLKEQLIQEFQEGFGVTHGIFHIDANAQLVDELSIGENLFAVRGRKKQPLFLPYNRKVVMLEAREVLRKVGLFYEPETKVWQLDPFERFQVCLAKALVNGVRLLLIDDVENEYNSAEKKRIRELIHELREDGVASLILADRPGELLDGARKIVLIKNGRNIKTYYSQDKVYFSQGILYETVAKAWLGVAKRKEKAIEPPKERLESEISFVRGNQKMKVSCGGIIGIYDSFWDKEKNLKEYLADYERVNDATLYLEEEGRAYLLEELLEVGKAVYIPRDSAFLLLENVSIGRNITIPNRKRATRGLGLTVKRIDDYMEGVFCENLGLELGTPVWKLNCMEKKILSIYRWLLQKPQIIILEDPTYRLNLKEEDGVREYLKNLAAQGVLLIVSEGSFYEEELLCDLIIHTERNHFLKAIKRKDYPQVNTEWLL